MTLFESILKARGLLSPEDREKFLYPNYQALSHDPFLLPDMAKAVERLVQARQENEHIMIYGDYDIDGLTASTLLVEALGAFGFKHIEVFIPNRFVEGYGMTVGAVDKISQTSSTLIITVDCGSLSEKEIIHAKSKNIDVIVTDHHNVAPVQPPAVAVINPKRLLQDYPDAYKNYRLQDTDRYPDLYPFVDLPGVGVAFKLVQALQTRLKGLEAGQEKWLLDLVALGTVCDVVTLQDENRMNVYWGLKVLQKTRRVGLRALMAVSGVEPEKVTARSLGFGLGPRMNAAGRLETAKHALDVLLETEGLVALEKAQALDVMNTSRRQEQDAILKEALLQAKEYSHDCVLVVSAPGWNHGIIGIVAAKLLERFKKPTYVMEEMGAESKGSARSYGDFNAADAIRASDDIITKGGGHRLAAGVTLPTDQIQAFRTRVNDFYAESGLDLADQQQKLLPSEDVTATLGDLSEELIGQIELLEPFGSSNERPVLKTVELMVKSARRMGADGQHVKLSLSDGIKTIDFLAFNADQKWFVEPGDVVDVWYQPEINEWQGRRSVEGRLVRLESSY